VAIYKGFYACLSAVKDGVARCRKEFGKCDSHRNGGVWAKAPQPNVVLFKVNVNDRWEAAFRAAGVRVVVRSWERAEQLGQRRAETAQHLGRNSVAIRDGVGRNSGVPEDNDTGCPVFGPGGLKDLSVSVEGLDREMSAAGFVITDVHLLKRPHKPPVRLVVEYSPVGTKPPAQNFPGKLFARLIATTFNQVDVWANERKADGTVPHTVNCGKRDDAAKPQHTLVFKDGEWDAIPVEESVPALAAAE